MRRVNASIDQGRGSPLLYEILRSRAGMTPATGGPRVRWSLRRGERSTTVRGAAGRRISGLAVPWRVSRVPHVAPLPVATNRDVCRDAPQARGSRTPRRLRGLGSRTPSLDLSGAPPLGLVDGEWRIVQALGRAFSLTAIVIDANRALGQCPRAHRRRPSQG